MLSGSGGFVKDIEPRFDFDPNETVFHSLFKQYEQVVFKSLITAFGLDCFFKDQYGGDVDTIHNVRRVGLDAQMSYKNANNEQDYEDLEEYSYDEYHKKPEKSPNYIKMTTDARNETEKFGRPQPKEDAYTGKTVYVLSRHAPPDIRASVDHVLSSMAIHKDRGRVLAGISGEALNDAQDNLRWTSISRNSSMGATKDADGIPVDIPEYIKRNPELPEEEKNKMMDVYNQAKDSYEEKLARAYYFDFSNPNCKRFYRDAAHAAERRGIQMGIREALGFLVTEFWFSIKDEFSRSDGTVSGALTAITAGLEKGAENARANYKHLLARFGEGVMSGILASFTSTLCNIFFTTSKNLGKILRQTWASVVEATSILFFNEKEQYLCDRMTSAAKVIATGASMIIGTSVQEKLQIALSEVPIPNAIKNALSTFAGSLCTGLLSISLLFYIDNAPFNKFLEKVYGTNIENLKEQGRLFKEYCAQLENIDVERLEYEASYVYNLSIRLDAADNQSELHSALEKAVTDLGIPSLLGNYTLDEKMNDRKWVLTF